MQFLNMAQGDAPYFKQLAQQYALSDNFHQSVMGGTGANHIMLGFGDAIYYADANGNPDRTAVEPDRKSEHADGHQQLVGTGRLQRWFVRELRG
jgi:phospholipase C